MKKTYFYTCPNCGSNLDPGEKCDCQVSQKTADLLDLPVYAKGNKKIIDDIARRGLPLPQNPTIRDYLVSSVLITTARKGTARDLLAIMELTGEKPVEHEGDTLQKARELLAGIESVIN